MSIYRTLSLIQLVFFYLDCVHGVMVFSYPDHFEPLASYTADAMANALWIELCVCLVSSFCLFMSFSSIIENNIIVKIRVRYVTTFKIQEGCPVLTKDLWYKGSCFAWLAYRTRNIHKCWVLLHKWTIGIDESYPPRLRILDMSVQESPWVDAFSSEIDSGLRFLV